MVLRRQATRWGSGEAGQLTSQTDAGFSLFFFSFFSSFSLFFVKHRAVPVNASPCPDMACAGTCAAI